MHPEEVRRRARLGQLPGARPPQRRVFVLEDLAAHLRSLYAAPEAAQSVWRGVRGSGTLSDMRANPYDTRDAKEQAEVSALLDTLPSDHPACEAYARCADTTAFTHRVTDRPERCEALKEPFLAGYRRLPASTGPSRPF